MPSSITLTVSHLPTSTSFFLSALQPLDYVYRGRTANTIGFGPKSSPSTPTDFWITQEVPGVPAGAAHVAFPAPNRTAVQLFFVAALKAGGKIHGEPAVRDSCGYYSAAIIDFDGNSIEAVYRPTFSDDKENNAKSRVSRSATSNAKSAASVAPSAMSQSNVAPPVTAKPSGDIIDNILNQGRTAANLARQVVNHVQANDNGPGTTPAQKSSSSDAILGALLGVAAGAALHYAFTTRDNNSDNSRPSHTSRSVTEPAPQTEYQRPYYLAIEGAPSSCRGRAITMQDNDYESTRRGAPSARGSGLATPFGNAQSPVSKASRQTGTKMIEASRSSPPTSYKAPTAITSTETVPVAGSLASKAQSSRRSSSTSRSQSSRHSDSDHTVVRVTHSIERIKRSTTFPTTSSPHSRASNHGSQASTSTVRPASKAATVLTSNKEPREYPLPLSRASTSTESFYDSRSRASKSKHSSASKNSQRESRDGKSRSESGRSSLTRSVVGKIKDVEKLRVTSKEVAPEDSVSQVSTRV